MGLNPASGSFTSGISTSPSLHLFTVSFSESSFTGAKGPGCSAEGIGDSVPEEELPLSEEEKFRAVSVEKLEI